MKPWMGWALAALAFALLVRFLFPQRVEVPGVPRITTVYDTVRSVDTAWVTRVRKDTVRVNVVERVTVTVPETLLVFPPRIDGMTALHVGQRVGDSTIVLGFTITASDSGIFRQRWVVQAYTAGPLRGIIMDSLPRFAFYDPPPKPCQFWCKAKIAGVGILVGAGVASALR